MANHRPSSFNISSEVSTVLPQHISSSAPDLVTFLEKFLEFMETDNKSLFYLNSISDVRDIDEAEDIFLARLQNEIGQAVPRQFPVEPRLLYKHLTELYRSRGTIDSIKAFFRLFYDDEVEIYFPKDDLFAPSDGRWFDQTEDTIANPSNFAAAYTYTLTSATSILSGMDDMGNKLLFDGILVYVDDVLTTDFKTSVKPSTNEIDYFITFPTAIASGKVIKIYRKGVFTTPDGFVSSSKKLQDSFYWQRFSYVLRTGANAELWSNAFNRLIHPAGFIFFGEILLTIYLNSILSLNQPGRQSGGLPFPVVIPVTRGKSEWNELYNVNPTAEFILAHKDDEDGFDIQEWKFDKDYVKHFVVKSSVNYFFYEAISNITHSDPYDISDDPANDISNWRRLKYGTDGWELSSYVLKEFKFDHHEGAIGREWFDNFKFHLISPIHNWRDVTNVDIINKIVDGNVEAEIYQSDPNGPVHNIITGVDMPPVITGPVQFLLYL
jgi:hypothetical protein